MEPYKKPCHFKDRANQGFVNQGLAVVGFHEVIFKLFYQKKSFFIGEVFFYGKTRNKKSLLPRPETSKNETKIGGPNVSTSGDGRDYNFAVLYCCINKFLSKN